MKHYIINIRRNKKENETYYILAKSNYKAIKETAEIIKQYKTDMDIIQIKLQEDNKLVCKFTPFTVEENGQQVKKYTIGF